MTKDDSINVQEEGWGMEITVKLTLLSVTYLANLLSVREGHIMPPPLTS